MNEYKVYTKSCYWLIYADDDVDAVRAHLAEAGEENYVIGKVVKGNHEAILKGGVFGE